MSLVSCETPWKPATMAIAPSSSAVRRRPGVTSMIRALPCVEVVSTPACEPVYDLASYPRLWIAMASRAIEMRSPAVSSMSSSRPGGSGLTWLARSISSSVVSPIAETTTTTSSPALRAATMRSATRLMRSAVATDEPPYFCTTSATTNHSFGLYEPAVPVRTVATTLAATGRRADTRSQIPAGTPQHAGREAARPTTVLVDGGENVSVRPRSVPRRGLSVSAAALLTLGVAACGDDAPATGPAPSTPPPVVDDTDARTELAARAALAQDHSFAALYTLDDGTGAPRNVVATVGADGSWKVDVSGGLRGGTADVSIVSTAGGVYQCTMASPVNPITPTCIRVADAGKRVPRAYDPKVERLFRQWLSVFTDRQAALSIAEVQ